MWVQVPPSLLCQWLSGRAPGCDPGGRGFDPRLTPSAPVVQSAEQLSCKQLILVQVQVGAFINGQLLALGC